MSRNFHFKLCCVSIKKAKLYACLLYCVKIMPSFKHWYCLTFQVQLYRSQTRKKRPKEVTILRVKFSISNLLEHELKQRSVVFCFFTLYTSKENDEIFRSVHLFNASVLWMNNSSSSLNAINFKTHNKLILCGIVTFTARMNTRRSQRGSSEFCTAINFQSFAAVCFKALNECKLCYRCQTSPLDKKQHFICRVAWNINPN